MDDNNFFSINRLVEFGMGLAIAQQMVKSMNQAITSMHVPGAMNPIKQSEEKIFYAIIGDQKVGPLSETELSQLISEKKIVNETYMWIPGMNDWVIAENIPEVVKIVALTPPPINSII